MRHNRLAASLLGAISILMTVDAISWRCTAQNLTVLHAFSAITGNSNQDGANPIAAPIALDGTLCGSTVNGGIFGSGTIFNLGIDGSGFTAFRSFTNSPDAAFSQADITAVGTGFYDATVGGGINGTGTVVAGQTNSASVSGSFASLNSDNGTNSTGASPGAAVIVAGGKLYGTASAGGGFGNGAIFTVNTNGSGLNVLHHFSSLDSVTGTNTDGATPWGGLVSDGNTLYGTTSAGGPGGNGTIFSLNTNGSFNTLYGFSAVDPISGTNADGAIPYSGLLLIDQSLYGTAIAGGNSGNGVVFSICTNGSGFTVLHHFSARNQQTNADGATPFARLAASANTIYGTAATGGAGGSGTVFSLKINGEDFVTLHSFAASGSSYGTNTDGASPIGGVLWLSNCLYGTTFAGGSGSSGTIFKLSLPPAPAIITRVFGNSDRSVTIYFLGTPNSTNIVQTSTNLAPPIAWQNISTNVADSSGSWQFTQTNIDISTRFYRSYAP